MARFEGRVALVTGGSRGIGRATALMLAREGAHVVVSSRKLEACDEVVEEIRASGGQATAIACNISVAEQCGALVAGAIERCGGIDVLVLNAALNPYFGPVGDTPMTAAVKTVEGNVLGNLALAQAAFPSMKARGGGAIVLVSSIGGRLGGSGFAVYNASKAAGEQLVRSLATEWGRHNIRTNAVAPGLIRTDMAKVLLENPERLAATEKRNPLKRIGSPEDVAAVIAFLAGPESAYVNGQTLVVDGGQSIAG
jgi:NAD(P)-dependent dehydrogenase (short-subunit alcohol dehydrogenase family)